jgi:deazaflavin-dependent oxidoreductase (nitroreductase family)
MRYQEPDFLTRTIFNPAVAFFTGTLGLSLRGSRVLAVRGRKSGEWRTTPVNPLTLEGHRYLVAPRGVTHWVRNIRASGEGVLRKGRHEEPIRVVELSDAEKPPVIRAYLQLWGMETRKFFGLKDANVPDAEIARIAPNHPVFRIL